MSTALRRVVALSFVLVAAQSCVLERLAADRTDPAGEAGNASAGTGNASAGGTSSSAGSGGGARAGTGNGGGASAGRGGAGGSPAAGSGGSGGNTSSAGTSSEGGSGGEPDAPWVRCDPTFAAGAYLDCPSLQPNLGELCDENVFYPEDYCAYCQNAAACPVQTDYVTLNCQNRSWQIGSGSGIGCCPNKLPSHGTACEGTALCDYGVSDSCECFEGKWQCCPDAYDGGVCTEPGKQCVVTYGVDIPDRCTCAGSANDELWSCCPVSAPMTGDLCYADAATCTYPQRSCTCATYGAAWSCN